MVRTPSELFDKIRVKKQCSAVKVTDEQIDAVKEWIGLLDANKLEKEKENQPKFEQIVLQKILGYSVYDYVPEKEFIDYTIDDSASGKSICIEVKGTSTKDLLAYQSRGKKDKENPLAQTWTYMGQGYDYGICTNYKEFILLSKDVGTKKIHRFDFLSIKLSEDKLNEDKLKEFIGIFSKQNIFENNIIEKLEQESQIAEQEFTSEFYKLYHETRLMLIREFETNASREDAIHWAQVFLNRLIFIFFVEDNNFIPVQLFAKRILAILASPSIDETTQKIFEDIKGLFKIMDTGSKIQGVYGFNGGLFANEISSKMSFSDLKDPEFFKNEYQNSKLSKKSLVADIQINLTGTYGDLLNPIIKNLLIMDSYDFTSDLNVNILGHIFEHSISDIESLQSNETSERKKQGVFYTPEYITDYICRNTIIPYLSKTEKISVIELVDEYDDNLDELESKIKNLKILDPACGSGAFLVKAVDVLFEIDREIQSRRPQNTIAQRDIGEYTVIKEINLIIENNIYGVDINPESVEITKLSLFLKLAGPERKLSHLGNNIKVGNSITNDHSKENPGFKWEKEFPEILNPIINNNGFDIVLGNPPYVSLETLKDDYKSGLKHYPCYAGKADLLYFFYNKGIDLLKKNGILCFITSRYFLEATYAKDLRKYILEHCTLDLLIDLSTVNVFKDIGIHTVIVKLNKQNKERSTFSWKIINDEEKLNNEKLIQIKQSSLTSEQWVLGDLENLQIYEKIKSIKNSVLLTQIAEIEQGVKTGLNKAFIVNSKMIESEKLEKQFIKKLVNNSDIHKFISEEKDSFLIYTSDSFSPTLGSNITKHLESFKDDLLKRVETGTVTYPWYRLQRPRRQELFDASEKIIVPYRSTKNKFAYDTNHLIGKTDVHVIVLNDDRFDTKYVLGILNSKLINFFYSFIGRRKGKNFEYFVEPLKKIPIVHPDDDKQKLIIELVTKLIELNYDYLEINIRLLEKLEINFNIINFKNFKNWFKDDFKEFLKKIKKQRKSFSNFEQDDWKEYFLKEKKSILNTISTIYQLEERLNNIVFDLYKINENERNLIESKLILFKIIDDNS